MGCACCERTVSALIVNVKLSCPTIIHPLCVRSDYIGTAAKYSAPHMLALTAVIRVISQLDQTKRAGA